MEFLLAHSVTDKQAKEAKVEMGLDKSYEALSRQDVADGDKNAFVCRLRAQVDEIRRERRGRASEEDVTSVCRQLRHFTEVNDSARNRRQAIRSPEIDNPHAKFPSFAKCVDVAYDSDKGRAVLAKRDIQLGELIMSERPHTLFFCPFGEKLSLLKSHCVHCMRFSPAPLPCENCCVVCFCSLECKEAATNSYHKYECKMKLYEMLHEMGDEYVDVFMAIRSITQTPCEEFMDMADEIWAVLDLEYPELMSEQVLQHIQILLPHLIVDDVASWDSSSVLSLLRLMGHQNDIEEALLLRNAVISVFFLRALQVNESVISTKRICCTFSILSRPHLGCGLLRRRNQEKASRRQEIAVRGKTFYPLFHTRHSTSVPIREPERLILCMLNHLINVQQANAEPFTRLVGATAASADEASRVYFKLDVGKRFFEWERVGSCISPSLALVNHSCDANAVRFFIGDHIALVASRFIPAGAEITVSYDGIHHESQPLFSRQLQCLRRWGKGREGGVEKSFRGAAILRQTLFAL